MSKQSCAEWYRRVSERRSDFAPHHPTPSSYVERYSFARASPFHPMVYSMFAVKNAASSADAASRQISGMSLMALMHSVVRQLCPRE